MVLALVWRLMWRHRMLAAFSVWARSWLLVLFRCLQRARLLVAITIEAHKQSGFGFEAGVAGLAAYTAVSTVMCFT